MKRYKSPTGTRSEKRLDDLSLKTKWLILSSVLLFLVLSFLICVYTYWESFVQEEFLHSFSLSCQQIEQSIEDNLERQQMIVRILCESTQFKNFIDSQSYEEGERLYVNSVKPVLDVLTETAIQGQIIQLIRYSDVGYEVILNDYEGIQTGIARNSLDVEKGVQDYVVVNRNRVANAYWFRELKESLNEYHIQQVNMDYLNNCFSIVAEFNDDQKSLGMIRLIRPIADLIGEEEDALSFEKGNIFVLDENFYLISSKTWKKNFIVDHRSMFDAAIEQLQLGKSYQLIDDQWIISADRLDTTDYYLIVIASSHSLAEKTSQLQKNMFCVFTAICLLTCGFAVGISHYIAKRLQHLLHAMQRFQDEGNPVSVIARSNDEIGMLYAGFNQMTVRINVLMKQNIDIATEKTKVELQLLLMQINPHFLYNSLSTISRLAEWGETETIRKEVTALTTFYRLTLNKGHDFYTVKDEKSQIEAYLQIFRIRKGDSFSSRVIFDSACSDYRIPKLLLQPFVENIFMHAFSEEHQYLHIDIQQRREGDMLIFTISDDGRGIPEKRLTEIRTGHFEKSSGGFGIANVVARLHLLFGETDLLSVDSADGHGTYISLRIPCDESSHD